MHLEYAIRNGKTVEQFLGGFDHEGEKAIRYLTIRRQKDEFWLYNHEIHDEGSPDYLDLYAFGYLNMPEDRFEPYPIKFASMEDAVRYAISEFDASEDRWVNQGVVQSEYGDYLLDRNSTS